jgi:hypothetical protein
MPICRYCGGEYERRPAQYRPRICILCGEEYTPAGSTQKVCVNCRDRYRKEHNKAHHRKNYQRTSPEVLSHQRSMAAYKRIEDAVENLPENIKSAINRTINHKMAQKGHLIAVRSVVLTALRRLGMTRNDINRWLLQGMYKFTGEELERRGAKLSEFKTAMRTEPKSTARAIYKV